MDRDAPRPVRARARGARPARGRASLRRFRPRCAGFRLADEAEPRSSVGAAACGRGQRRRPAAGSRLDLPGLPDAAARGAVGRFSRPHLGGDRAPSVQPGAPRSDAREVPIRPGRRVPGRGSRSVRAAASDRTARGEPTPGRRRRPGPIHLWLSGHRAAAPEPRLHRGLRQRDPAARGVPALLPAGARRGRATPGRHPTGEGDPVDEAVFCAREIKRLRSEWPEVRLADFAIVLRSTTAFGGPFEEALRALGLPCEVRGWGATARNEVVRFLIGYLESMRRPDDSEALESILASSLGGVGPKTVSRLRARARERGQPLKKVVDRVIFALAARDPSRYPLPWGEPGPTAGRAQDALSEIRPEPDFMSFLSEAELDELYQAMVARHHMLGLARRLPLASLAYSALIEHGAN